MIHACTSDIGYLVLANECFLLEGGVSVSMSSTPLGKGLLRYF